MNRTVNPMCNKEYKSTSICTSVKRVSQGDLVYVQREQREKLDP